jgi:undecaprenyl-diphosphatase
VSELTYIQAIVLGVLQGLTEFLPISSSAHLALGQGLFNLDPRSQSMLLFDVCAHVGTVVAVLIILARPTGRFLSRLIRETNRDWNQKRYAWRVALLGILASIPTAAIGFGFRRQFEAAFAQPVLIGACLMVTGVLLISTKSVPRGRRGWAKFAWWQAVLVGFAQGAAILPGISRSGATISVAVFLGLRRRWAAEFSFLVAVPAILGATLVQLSDASRITETASTSIPWGPILVGSLVSFLVGLVALKILLGVVRMRALHYFAPYCFVLGLFAIVVAVTR